MNDSSVSEIYYIVCSQLNITKEELLFDFHELIREHSGENLAEAVFDMLQLDDLRDKVKIYTSSPTLY